MERGEQAVLIAIFTLVFLGVILVVLFVVFQRRKNALILEQEEAEKRFEQEISKTQVEIREATFRNISWELHDNIGQLLTLAKIQLQNNSNLDDVKSTLDKGLQELRILSKRINPDVLNNIKLIEAITQEIERFNRLNFVNASISVLGEVKEMDNKTEIVFFRIIQEFFSNTIKHARAKNLNIVLNYKPNKLIITATDDGQGFSLNKTNYTGIGLMNIKSRAQLMNADVTIFSKPEEGTRLTLIYKYKL